MRIEYDPTNPILPPWLANPDAVAPCPCGEPIESDEYYVTKGEDTGLMRVYHPECLEKYIEVDHDD